ncbi:uncharacterized protein BDZ83DRAFT_266725 [Colletotrichum acutatum]|uniref:Uncharacterized protein n=1 Tax=Glomerella acutata TaxID=27357 RepID=A0AAD8UKY4_GLOAC|nr:uncharacterized protein BDZ83DRAFT_266725 [Colletotrichum acutatum]KAK1726197.1 hypothetical protein BDZ83DRAFT_266725 [Colletotrichum acutatum]
MHDRKSQFHRINSRSHIRPTLSGRMDHPIRELTAFLGLLICGCSLEDPVLVGRVQVLKKTIRQDEVQHHSRQSRKPITKVANTTGPNSTGLELSPSMGLWRTNSNEDHSQKMIRLITIFDAVQRGAPAID